MGAPDGSKLNPVGFPYTTMYNITGTLESVEDGGYTLVIEPDLLPSQYDEILDPDKKFFNTHYARYLSGGELIIETQDTDSYYNLTVKTNTGQIKNLVNVTSKSLTKDTSSDFIYESTEEITLESVSEDLTIEFDEIPVDPDSVTFIITNVSGLSFVSSSDVYAWGAYVTVSGTLGNIFSISATGIKCSSQDITYSVNDSDSIKEYGEKKYDFPENQLMQSYSIAKNVADNLLSAYKDNRKDATISRPCTLLNNLSDLQLVVEYKDDLIKTVSPFYIVRNNIKFNGAIDEECELRRKGGSRIIT